MKKKEMKIVFNGRSGQIDANTLIVALGHYQTIMSEANKALGAVKTVELKVNALEKGSFVIDVSVVESVFKQIFSGDSIEYIANICAIVGGVYGAYRILGGRSARTEKQKDNIRVKVRGKDNTVVNNAIINIYNQIPVRESISKTIEAAKEDPNVEGLTIEGADEKITFTREKFDEYIHKSFDTEDLLPPDKTEIVKENLTIISLSFEPGNSWQFMYRGFKIGVRVKDNILMELIDQGERFGKGDSIEVELEITQRYNPDYRAYENKSYRILQFYKHNEAPEQQPLF